MPVAPTYPGVYIEEIPSGVRTITGVATSITAFIGRALRVPVDEPVRITSFADFERRFGGLWTQSTMSYAVQQYYLNGGSDAVIVRIENGATFATLTLPAGGDALTLRASSEGAWGNNLRATVDHDTADPADTSLFNLTVEDVDPNTSEVRATETLRNLSVEADASRFVTNVLAQESALVRVQGAAPGTRPDEGAT